MATNYEHFALIAHTDGQGAPLINGATWVPPHHHPNADRLNGQRLFLNVDNDIEVEVAAFNMNEDGQMEGVNIVAPNLLTKDTANKILTFVRSLKAGYAADGLMIVSPSTPMDEALGGFVNPRVFQEVIAGNGNHYVPIDGELMAFNNLQMTALNPDFGNGRLDEATIKSCRVVGYNPNGRFNSISAIPRLEALPIAEAESFLLDVEIVRFLRASTDEVTFVEVPGNDDFIQNVIARILLLEPALPGGLVLNDAADSVTWFFSGVQWPTEAIKPRAQSDRTGYDTIDGVDMEVFDYFFSTEYTDEEFKVTIIALAEAGFGLVPVVRGMRITFRLDEEESIIVENFKKWKKPSLTGEQKRDMWL